MTDHPRVTDHRATAEQWLARAADEFEARRNERAAAAATIAAGHAALAEPSGVTVTNPEPDLLGRVTMARVAERLG